MVENGTGFASIEVGERRNNVTSGKVNQTTGTNGVVHNQKIILKRSNILPHPQCQC